MENYENILLEALEAKRASLNKDACPKLKSAFGQLRVAFQNFYGILLNKGIIRPDEYRDEQKLRDLVLPSAETFPESQRASQMSIRLSEMDHLYDYLHMFIEVSPEGLALRSLKKITEILKYFEWNKLAVNTEHYMTQSLALLVIQTRSDSVTERLLQDLVKQMALGTREALEQIRELTEYQKQHYKHTLRELFFDKTPFDSNAQYAKAQENFITQLRKTIGKDGGILPFYRELVVEACDEIYSNRADDLQTAALNSLKIRGIQPQEAPKKKKVVEKNPKESLFLAFFEMGRSAASFEAIANKLNYNHETYIKHGLSFGEKLVLMLKNFMRGHSNVTYKTSFTDPTTGTKYNKEIVFHKFMERLEDRTKFLTRFSTNTSPAYKKLNEMSDQQIEDLLGRQINEAREILTDCSALDAFFRNYAAGGKFQARGLKIEITSIKRLISRALELRHEYVTEKDASVSLKNLGI